LQTEETDYIRKYKNPKTILLKAEGGCTIQEQNEKYKGNKFQHHTRNFLRQKNNLVF
jgi:hypothetical protein